MRCVAGTAFVVVPRGCALPIKLVFPATRCGGRKAFVRTPGAFVPGVGAGAASSCGSQKSKAKTNTQTQIPKPKQILNLKSRILRCRGRRFGSLRRGSGLSGLLELWFCKLECFRDLEFGF